MKGRFQALKNEHRGVMKFADVGRKCIRGVLEMQGRSYEQPEARV